VIALQQIRYITTSRHVFLSTLMLVLLLNPLSIFSLSFWLSFWAVAVILYAIESMPDYMTSGWQKILWMQTILLIGMLPLNLWLFEQTSIIGFIANLIAIPYVSFIVIPVAIAGSIMILINFQLGQWLFIVAEHALGYLWWLLNWFSSLPIAIWHHPIAHPWILGVLLAGGVVLIYAKPIAWHWRAVGMMGMLPLLLIAKPTPHAGDAWVTVLAVKKGFIDIVRTQSHTLVWCHAKGAFSERLWQKTLKHQGINPAHAHLIGIKDQHNALWQTDGVIFKQTCQHRHCHLLLTAHHKTIILPEKRKNHEQSALIIRITDKGVRQFFYGAGHRHFWDSS
jgi:competence protein ComEC